MTGLEKQYDDPIWEYALVTRLMPYLPSVRNWWNHHDELDITSTAVFPVEDKDAPPGLMYRVTNTPVRSPIKGVQVFPFVPVAYLQMSGVAGGVQRMVTRLCSKGLELEEFLLIEKHNLPATYSQGQIIAFVPKDIIEGARSIGKYVYLTVPELYALAHDSILPSVKAKVARYI